MIICPKCNKQLEDGTQVCDACGENLVPQAAPAQDAAPAAAEAKQALDIKKLAIIGAAAVAVIVLVILIGSLLFGGGEPNYAVYIKDGELVFSDFKKPYEFTDDFADGIDNSQLAGAASQLSYSVHLTKDGKKLFYIDEVGPNGNRALYVRNANKPKAEPTKLDSDVSVFMVNESGTIVTYLKDGTLYRHDLKEKEKIYGDVENFVSSLDGKKVVFETVEGDLYISKGKDKEEKIASEIDYLVHVNKAFSEIYYTKENALYFKKGSKNVEKLCSDVDDVVEFYDNGTFYYTEAKEEEEEGGAEQFDAESTFADELDKLIEQRTQKLYYFNGKEKKVVADKFYGSYRTCADKAVVAYKTIDSSDIKEEEFTGDLDAFAIWNIAVEDKGTEIDLDDVRGLSIAHDGKSAYAWTVKVRKVEADTDTDTDTDTEAEPKPETATLYKIKIGKSAEKPEQYEEDIYPSYISLTSAGNIMYYKDVKENKGELFIDKTKIDDDVRVGSVRYMKDSKKVAYYTDWDSEKSKGTVEISTLKGKTTKVGDNAFSFVITPDEDILYLTEYKNNKGELYLFTGNKAKKIDDDVVGILSYNSYTNMAFRELGWIKD